MLIFNGKKYFVPFFNGGSGQDTSTCRVKVSNLCPNYAVKAYAQPILGTIPNCLSIPHETESNLSTANKVPMYIIGDGLITANYDVTECICANLDGNIICAIVKADNTEIEVSDTALFSDDGSLVGLHQMNTEEITSPLNADTVVDIGRWNEALSNIPFYFGGVPEVGTNISDTSAYCHIAFSIDGDTFYIRDVDNDVVICTVVDGVPNWTENYYSQWFIPSYSTKQEVPLSFISWFNNNVVSSEYYYDLSNMVFTFSSNPTFEDWYADVALPISAPFRDEFGNEYYRIVYIPDYGYTDENGVHIFNGGQIVLLDNDGMELVYGRDLTTSMVITFGEGVYVTSIFGDEYKWFFDSGSLVPQGD